MKKIFILFLLISSVAFSYTTSYGNFRNSQFAKEDQLKTQVSLVETLENLDIIVW